MAQPRLPTTAPTTIKPTTPTAPATGTAPQPWSLRRAAIWLLAPLALLLLAVLLLVLALAIFGANWARSPLEQLVQAQTGRALRIAGALQLDLGWPTLRLQAQDLRFANPAWAQQPQMLVVDSADLRLDLPALLRGRLLLPVVRVGRPVVMLEVAADGRKSWLLDRHQRDDSSAVQIGRLTLRQGQLGYDDARQQTRLQLALDTVGNRSDAPVPGPTSALGARSDVLFSASGTWHGLPLQARGRGASVLGLRDASMPYPLQLEASIGATQLRADGRISGLAQLGALDLQLALQGDSLAQLDALLGVGLPQTAAYAASGRLLHSGGSWRYQAFSGQVGRSDVAGSLQLDRSGARPLLRGDVTSRLLDLADLGPLIGLRPGGLLPALALQATGWRSFDADLQLTAQHVLRARALPLDGGSARLQLQDAVLTLDPLRLRTAGGELSGSLVLDARQAQIQASAKLQAHGLQLAQLVPGWDQARAGMGRVHADADLRGHGNTLAGMLATADGRLRLQAEPGRISRLLMAQLGGQLLEMLQLSLGGDQSVQLRCAVADFSVQQGVMTARSLALDTAVGSVSGGGRIDLAQQTLDLVLVPRNRNTSLVALRGPIRVHGPLGAPVVSPDSAGMLARGAGALALGLVNPLLALVPLVEPGKDSGRNSGKNGPSPCAQASAALGLTAQAAAAQAPAPRAAPAAPRSGTRAGTTPPAPPPSRP